MNIIWQVSEIDIQNVKNVLLDNENTFTHLRQKRNINKEGVSISKQAIIKSLIMCLLTSQQRSGPDSPISIFLNKNPFPLDVDGIIETDDVEHFVKNILINNNLPRFINKISSAFSYNIEMICDQNWQLIDQLEKLNSNSSKEAERILADSLNDSFRGFGPKQSRNFLQSLGLTKFEIPIDSRITTWLNNNGFPVTLSPAALADKSYYHFVSDGIQYLCQAANVYPCMLDAAIFSSYDNGQWTEQNNVF